MNWITRLFRREAYMRQLKQERDAAIAECEAIKEGIARISRMQMSADENRGHVEIEMCKEFAIELCRGFAELLVDAPNYAELTYTLECDYSEKIIVTAHKCNGKTPHELRIEAERERDMWKARCERAESEIVPLCAAGPWRHVSDVPAKDDTVLGWSGYGVDLFMYYRDYDQWTDSAGNKAKPVYIAQINPVKERVI